MNLQLFMSSVTQAKFNPFLNSLSLVFFSSMNPMSQIGCKILFFAELEFYDLSLSSYVTCNISLSFIQPNRSLQVLSILLELDNS